MKVFLSWSGETSHRIAKVFKKWIPGVIQAIEPFLSSKDIARGTDWRAELEKQLENTDIGIFFLTLENKNAPWIFYEAGSLKKKVPFLFDLGPDEIPGPLNNSQYTLLNKEDVRSLMEELNNGLGDKKLSERCFDWVFSTGWPRLMVELNKIKIENEKDKTNRIRKDDPKDALIKNYYSTIEELLEVEDKICSIKQSLFQTVINKELIEFLNKVSRWKTKRANLKPTDKYSDYLMKVYESARKDIFATCTKTCMDNFLSGKVEDDFLRIHKESSCKITRVFVFEDRKDIQKEYIDRIKMHNGIEGLTVYVYINNEDAIFAFPPDITRDFTVIDDGLIISIADHSSPRTTAQLTFDNEDDIRRFKSFREKLIAGSLKEDDPLYKKIFA
ncbi:MAG: hypothetical protein GTO45_05935 [Candidatus Aminicenantes bacterium]|nr:hypothetical protein [Candidatus Aminicenantes bacterium]NIM78374.1 hypothetical protein [Candidatus Aminicenantes bacterium]NIN17627.1 hypothetical protein [Candidatus Aminicenantes bacterium]NIN41503.1 hypothetical protein [Candidatus Aminicenantes bacterium]NIN84277.1 hypothetical protein [Candidatus Aminicenantes bacterium]